jgi:hypothetical protein
MRWLRIWSVLALVTVALISACGSKASSGHSTNHADRQSARAPNLGGEIPTPAPTGKRANPASVAVIKAWSTTLRRGDVRAAAKYFALPSELINGGGSGSVVITIHTFAQAVSANASLPCGAVFISADQRGPFVNALFRLTDRGGPGGGCGGGAGVTARTNFLIAHGKIEDWIRAPDDPGDNRGRPAPPGPANSPPTGGPSV